jgi:hypothetical protein
MKCSTQGQAYSKNVPYMSLSFSLPPRQETALYLATAVIKGINSGASLPGSKSPILSLTMGKLFASPCLFFYL